MVDPTGITDGLNPSQLVLPSLTFAEIIALGAANQAISGMIVLDSSNKNIMFGTGTGSAETVTSA